MDKENEKITYESVYKELKFNFPLENLAPVTAMLPKKIIKVAKLAYQVEIENLDMTFEEFICNCIKIKIYHIISLIPHTHHNNLKILTVHHHICNNGLNIQYLRYNLLHDIYNHRYNQV